MGTQVAHIPSADIVSSPLGDFDLHAMRIFTRIPAYHHDVVVLGGAVLVFETDSLCRDGILDGAFYVKEGQYPPSAMRWESWLEFECEDRKPRAQPRTPLTITRTVVQALRCSHDDKCWWHRLPSGFNDGPIGDWAVGIKLIGKVVGVYRPTDHGERQ